MTGRVHPSKLIFVAFAALAIAGLICLQFYPREVRNWESSLVTADGEMMRVLFTYSNTKQFGHAHLFLLGGDSPEFKARIISAKAEPIDWVGHIRPVGISMLHNQVYLVALGRQNGESNTRFVAAVHENGVWKEIPVVELPHVVAVNNCGFPDENADIISEIQNRDYLVSIAFRRSITARLWFCIVNGKNYTDVHNATIAEEFVTTYYERYFKPHYRARNRGDYAP